MIDNKLGIEHLLVAFAKKEEFYIKGYDLCIEYASDELVRLLKEKEKMSSMDAVSLTLDLKTKLLMRRPTKVLRDDYQFEPV